MADNAVIISADYEAMSYESSRIIIQTMQQYPEGLYCFAGGDTPVKTLQLLVEAHRQGEIDLSKAYYIELDEWVGLDQKDTGSCLSYLKRNLFDFFEIDNTHLHYFQPLSKQLEEECQKANAFIKEHGGLTLTLLGVGVNGHLGFNEPGVSFDNEAHIIDLDEKTKVVGQKYFQSAMTLQQGITLGIKQLMESEVLIVQANGSKKQEAIQKLLGKKVDKQWPVTIVNQHPNCYIVIDKEAAG